MMSERGDEKMVWQAETRKRIEEAFDVIEDCLDTLCADEHRYGMGEYFDSCWVHISDLENEYYSCMKRIDYEEERKK